MNRWVKIGAWVGAGCVAAFIGLCLFVESPVFEGMLRRRAETGDVSAIRILSRQAFRERRSQEWFYWRSKLPPLTEKDLADMTPQNRKIIKGLMDVTEEMKRVLGK